MSVEDYLKEEFGTLSHLIALHAAEQPDHVALVLDDRSVTYAELDAVADRVAAAMQRDGFRRGDFVAISSKNSLAYVFAMVGSLRAGVGVALLAPDMAAENLARMLADSDAPQIFLDDAVAQILGTTDAFERVRVVALDGSAHGKPFAEWLAPVGARPEPVTVGPKDPFNIIYSSGTTGTPKGIVLPHDFRWAQFQMFKGLGYSPDTVAMVSIPLYSNMTLSSFLPPLAMGGKIVLMAKFDARRYLELAEEHRVTHSMMVPVQFQRIMDVEGFERYDLSSFEVKSCGSAHFAAELKARILAHWPGELVEFYGMTEGGGVCRLDARLNPGKLHTVGHPLVGHDMRVIDEDGNELPPGSVGEIVGNSPTMMVCYHKLPEKTREAEWFDAAGKRFIRTGDVGRFDEDGFLVLMDRRKDMIISGGFNIYPSDLETVLREHPKVADVAVTGVPSARWGETPVAFVIAEPGSGLTEEELMGWSSGKVNKAQRIAAVEFVEDLPRNGIGKVLKAALKERWAASGRSL
ncbi:MAG: acyl--CoA ligase [Rhodobiaceae bacterium]|nr:acyl--CoA ligase [Rhodobiaceae bacterium]MCC0055223.1 acyl--CoA ligase [Rhodobiaceae bacterium]